MTTVELLHHISVRETIATLSLKPTDTLLEIAGTLFGINPIFGTHNAKPLLEKLDTNGTLFIQNIEYLDQEPQEHLG